MLRFYTIPERRLSNIDVNKRKHNLIDYSFQLMIIKTTTLKMKLLGGNKFIDVDQEMNIISLEMKVN